MVLTAALFRALSGNAARSSVIDPARQFADDDHVGAFHQVVLQRRRIDQRLVRAHRAQIRVNAQRLANAEQALFGRFSGGALSNSGSPTAPIRVASASSASCAVSSGNGVPVLMNRDAAQQRLVQIQLVIDTSPRRAAGRARLRA